MEDSRNKPDLCPGGVDSVRAGFNVFWFRERAKGILDGDPGIRLEADLRREVRWRFETDRGGLCHGVDVQVAGDEPGDALHRFLSLRPQPGGSVRFVERMLNLSVNSALGRAIAHGLARSGGAPPSPEYRIETHLPFLDRARLKEWERGELPLSIGIDSAGRLRAEGEEHHELLLLISAALAGPVAAAQPFELVFEDRRRTSPFQTAVGLADLMALYGFGEGFPAEGEWDVTWRIALPSAAIEAWNRIPRERSPEFFLQMSTASLALQRALRAWLPYIYFHDVRRLEDQETAWPLLVYGSMRPFRSRRLKLYTRDVLDRRSVESGLRVSGRSLSARLVRLNQWLADGGGPYLANIYTGRKADRLLADMARVPKWFGALLAGESHLLDELIGLALAVRTNRGEDGRPPSRVYALGTKIGRGLNLRLRRMFAGGGFPHLQPLILIEATRALALAQGRPAPLEISLQVADPGSRRLTWVCRRDGPSATTDPAGPD